jgi:hypothetical protein
LPSAGFDPRKRSTGSALRTSFESTSSASPKPARTCRTRNTTNTRTGLPRPPCRPRTDALQLSDADEGVHLLNPRRSRPTASRRHVLRNWLPGAERHPSFPHLMVHEYRSFARLENVPVRESDLLRLPVPEPDVPCVPTRRELDRRSSPVPAASSRTSLTPVTCSAT